MGLFGGGDPEEEKKEDIDLDRRKVEDRNINRLVKKAEGDTVTKDILTECAPESLDKVERLAKSDIAEEDYFVDKNPVIHYLSDSETPQFIFHGKVHNTEIMTLYANRNGESIFENQYKTDGGLVVCFTDERILLIRDGIPPETTGFFTKSQPDYTVDITYTKVKIFDFEWAEYNPTQVEGKKYRTQIHNLKFDLEDNIDYEIKVPRQYSDSEMNGLITYVSSRVESSDAQVKQKSAIDKSSKSKNKKRTDKSSKSKNRKNNSRNEILYTLRSMNPLEFEKVVANLWESQGWNVQLTSQSSDRGADVVATKEDTFESRRILIQAKKYGNKTKVSSKEMQQYAGLYARDEQVDSVFVVTSNEFTSEARQVAKNRKVEIINAKKLIELIREHNVNI